MRFTSFSPRRHDSQHTPARLTRRTLAGARLTAVPRRLVLAACLVILHVFCVNLAPRVFAQDNRQDGNRPVENNPPRVSLTTKTTTENSFDGERAFAHARKMVEIGPRPAGSKELEKTRRYIVEELKSYGLRVSTDEFRARTPVGERRMANITAELAGASSEVIILSSHYDTKQFKEFRFVGANDGASSSGALLELARAIAAAPRRPRFTYWFVFFDGEEAFCRHWDDCSKPDAPDNTYGSRRFVAGLKERGEVKRVRAMLLLDMIGYQRLELGRDPTSTKWLVDTIWQTARELGHGARFVERTEGIGSDDHEPFLRAGIDAVDIIQLNSYPYWHTHEDTLDKISAQSLKIVGDVVVASLPRIEERLSNAGASNQH